MALLEIDRLARRFVSRRPFRSPQVVEAVRDVSLSVDDGESVGLVGESGSGKTTVARCVLGLLPPSAGEIRLDGRSIVGLAPGGWGPLRRLVQPVFQDPTASLDPRLPVEQSVAEPLIVHRVATRQGRRARVAELLGQVGLDPSIGRRRPGELSGGQRQRVALARALALGPRLLLLDEPVSSLDASVGAQIINLLLRLQRDLGLALLFITHDLRLARHVTGRIAVMQAGRIVELAPTRRLFDAPRHVYTRTLLASAALVAPPASSAWWNAASRASEGVESGPLVEVAPDHWVREPA